MSALRSDRNLYLNADRSKVVEEDDPEQAWLLAGPGGLIDSGDVVRYQLHIVNGKVVIGHETPVAKMAAPPENKMAEPPENKVRGLTVKRTYTRRSKKVEETPPETEGDPGS
jgi:hypothetical protein